MLAVLVAVMVIVAGTAFDFSAFSMQAKSTTTTTTVTTSATTIASSMITSKSTTSCSVPTNCASVELLGCSVSTKVCSLAVQSGYTSGNIIISQDPGCIDLEWFPAPGVQSGTSSSSCTIAPSPTLEFGQRASVNATVDYYYIPKTSYGPPPVGSEVFGTLSIKNASAISWEQVSFSGKVTL
ncbi:MAG: hypothetical protein OK455_06805 [Thaumarchaeota archaeon]|nr:hypothetical protein [Nitrososphaerota archaeon]